jgi:hypothetical protein
MSDLKRYLDGLANGPLLDSVTQAPVRFPDAVGPAVIREQLGKRRARITRSERNRKPLVVKRPKRHKP